ncbi:MAG: hypothetical protein NT178_18465 [Proteobacteria bacterium]|nr:hypothetical protein [Pseudomonadota bacterium]
MKAKEKEILEQEMERLRSEVGADAEARTYLLFADIVQWLRLFGHGEVTLSAVENKFGLKYRTNSVKTVRKMTE